MGRTLSALESYEDHRTFSEVLETSFALTCRHIISEHGGSLIYSGGDDVLALAPIHTLLDLAEALKQQFDAAMDESGLFAGDISSPTLSIGVAIAHHMTPIGDVFHQARRAESVAKTTRDALAFIDVPRGGTERRIRGAWSGDNSLPGALRQWVRSLWKGHLPHGTAHKLAEIPAMLGVGTHGSDTQLVDTGVVRSLAARIVDRRQLKGQPEEIDVLINFIHQRMAYYEQHEDDAIGAINMLKDEILIAERFLQAEHAAFGRYGAQTMEAAE
jgi:CRISPR-associated protein Cmr2